MKKRISIDPITRLEGHGKIHIFLDQEGRVERTSFQVPDFKGFEKFCEGRAAEEMPTLTQKICGVCPIAHHMAASKALDDLFGVSPPRTARLIRELIHNAFVFEDHLLHFYFMGSPDFIPGPDAPVEERNIMGLVARLGADFVKKVMNIRKRVRNDIVGLLSGSPLYPVCGLPGGVSKTVSENDRQNIIAVAQEAMAFALSSLELFHEWYLGNPRYPRLLKDESGMLRIYNMGMVDESGQAALFDGQVRVTDPSGKLFCQFDAHAYGEHLAERVDPESYAKWLYLKKIGWRGLEEGVNSGVYRVGPLARLNVADTMPTPLAREEFEKMYRHVGEKPCHNIFAYHWARLIEVLCCAETMCRLARKKELCGSHARNIPKAVSGRGFGVCEAPRGTLFHHYETDNDAMITRCNLLVATQNNAAAIAMAIEKSARSVIRGDRVTPRQTNHIEMAFRAHDPCLACATHTIQIQGARRDKELIRWIKK